MTADGIPAEHRVLVLAAAGRDGPFLVETLELAGIHASVQAGVAALIGQLAHGVGTLLITHESLDANGLADLAQALGAQPVWSEVPLVLLTSGQPGADMSRLYVPGAFGPNGNVTFLERPLSLKTLVGTVRFALQSRRRQYDLRDLLTRVDQQAVELRQSNRDLENFASVASHDLQEPLRMITSYLGLIERRYAQVFDDKAKAHFAHVIDGSVRMREMINSIMQYSRIAADDIRERVDAQATVQAAMANLGQQIAERDASITIGRLPVVTGHPALFTLLFQNLIANAIKYTRERPVIWIHGDEQDTEWSFSIADNGIGIRPEDSERIFLLFTRLNGIGVSGAGIGLATCRKIVERHGGRIWVESAEGQGSVFRFVLPRRAPTPTRLEDGGTLALRRAGLPGATPAPGG